MHIRTLQAFVSELEKIANKDASSTADAKSDVSAGGAGAALVTGATAGRTLTRHGLAGTLGTQMFVHGTSNEAAKNILKEGLRAEHGGSSSGTSAAINDKHYVESSKGRVHVVKGGNSGLVSRAHAALAEAHAKARKAGEELSEAKAIRTYIGGALNPFHGGSVIGGAIPHEEFTQHFERDPDHVRGAFRGAHDIDPSRLSRGAPSILKVIKARSKYLPEYLSANKGRAARGAAMLTAAPAMMYGAYQEGKQLDS